MKNLSVFILVLLATTTSHAFPQEFQPITHDSSRTPKHIASPRMAYTTSVLHQDAKNPHQTAHSSIKVDIDSDKISYRRKNVGIPPQTQSQMFNVGYSMSFRGEPNNPKQYQPKFVQKPRLDHGEIITGKRKRNEEVQSPNLDLSPQEFVAQALMKNEMHRVKPNKYSYSTQSAPESLIKQANFSPKTQRYIKAYEKTKAIQSSTQKHKSKPTNEYAWRSLSPGVEIVKSSEIPINHKLSNEPVTYSTETSKPKVYKKVQKPEAQENNSVEPITYRYTDQIKQDFDPIKDFNYNFNHAGALEFSQAFDFTNGIDNSASKTTESAFSYAKLKESPQILLPKIPIDTSLLREPIITTDPKQVIDNPHLIPIHFDVRPLQQAMQNPDAFDTKHPITYVLPLTENDKNFNKMYQPQPLYNHQQQAMHEDYSYQDYQMASQNQFKIYGKPQPMKKKLFKPNYSDSRPRQPRHDFIENISDLRPPPIAHTSYQRRAYHHLKI